MEEVDNTPNKGYIMSDEKEYKEVRCEGKREHRIGGVNYGCCGSLLLNREIDTDCDIQVICRICKRFWNIAYKDGKLSVEEIERTENKRRGK